MCSGSGVRQFAPNKYRNRSQVFIHSVLQLKVKKGVLPPFFLKQKSIRFDYGIFNIIIGDSCWLYFGLYRQYHKH